MKKDLKKGMGHHSDGLDNAGSGMHDVFPLRPVVHKSGNHTEPVDLPSLGKNPEGGKESSYEKEHG